MVMGAPLSHATDAGGNATPPALVQVWPRSSQYSFVFLVVLTLGLLTAHVLIARLSDARPTTLDRGKALLTAINLNTADHATLTQLPDVGDTLARAIVEYRQARGSFTSVDELLNVPGIGRTRLARLRPWVYTDQLESPPQEQKLTAFNPVSTHGPSSPPPRPRKGEGLKGPIDLNSATEEELRRVDGLGPVLARRIVEARLRKPFRAVEDLLQIPYLKHKTLEKVRPHVFVKPPDTAYTAD
jgi:competence protein ComEA